jgi:hypothetical protein
MLSAVMPRAGGASSIPEAFHVSAAVSGILDRPVKPGDDVGVRRQSEMDSRRQNKLIDNAG